MVKNIFNSFSKGFFYTIGRIIAIGFILLVIYTLINKLGVDYEIPYMNNFIH